MVTPATPARRYKSFADFYPFYLHQHSNRTCRRIHVIGTSLVAGAFIAFLLTLNPWWLLAMPVVGYGFAWVGHSLMHIVSALFLTIVLALETEWKLSYDELIRLWDAPVNTPGLRWGA